MKTIIEYLINGHINKDSIGVISFDDLPHVIDKRLSAEANLDALMYITNEFYNEFSSKEIRKALGIMDRNRCSLSHADNTMSNSLHDAFNTWISNKEIEWEDEDTKKSDLRALQYIKDDYFDDDDFFMNMPDKKEFEKLKTQYNYDYN